jgi:hypothetical protein
MAKSAGGGGDEGAPAPEGLPQHPYVERVKPDPSQPAKRLVELVGLPGDSDRAGYQRLYLTTRLDYYAEFLTSDMVHAEAVPADRSPFPGHEATRVSIDRDATIHYIWARSPQPIDEFDLDIRLGAPRAAPAAFPFPTHAAGCISPANGCTDACHTQDTCTCHPTRCGGTCATCQGMATCPQTQCNTCPATCQTCAAQHTCPGHGTCATQCATCATCAANTCVDTCHV